MEAADEKRAEADRQRAWLAWHIAALPAQKKFPSLKEFMDRSSGKRVKTAPPPRRSADELQAIAMEWHTMISRMKH